MKTHQDIDRRSLHLAGALVKKIESGDVRSGIERAQMVNRRWLKNDPSRLHLEWSTILSNNWTSIRTILLDESERAAALRQNNPFCGILTPQERWTLLREYQDRET